MFSGQKNPTDGLRSSQELVPPRQEERARNSEAERRAAEFASLVLGQFLPQEAAKFGFGSGNAESEQQGSAEQSSGASASAVPGGTVAASEGRGAEALTPSQSADTSGSGNSDTGRLVVEVSSETLGQVQLVMDRDAQGLKVTVASSAESLRLISADKTQLLAALGGVGVKLSELRLVTTEQLGTVLAEKTSSRGLRGRSRGAGQNPDSSESPEQEASRSHSRLDLIG